MLRAIWYEGTAQLLCLTELKSHLFELYFIGWTIKPTVAQSGMDLLKQLYVLAHWGRSCRSNLLSVPVTVFIYTCLGSKSCVKWPVWACWLTDSRRDGNTLLKIKEGYDTLMVNIGMHDVTVLVNISWMHSFLLTAVTYHHVKWLIGVSLQQFLERVKMLLSLWHLFVVFF